MPISVTAPHPQYSGKQNGSLIPEVWSKKLLEHLWDSTVLGEITNNDYESEIKKQGDKVIIRESPLLSIQPYTKGQELTYESPVSDDHEFSIDHARAFTYKLDDIDKYQSDLNLMNTFAENASTQMKIEIDSHVLGTIYSQAHAANAGNAAGRISSNINLGSAGTPLALSKANVLDFLVDVGTVMDEQNVPEQGRFIVMPAWACGMLKKSDLRDASITADAKSVLRSGRVGSIDRLTVYSSNLLHSDTGNFDLIAGHKMATCFATQITELEQIRSEKSFATFTRGLNVYGFKVLKPEALVWSVVTRS